MRRLSTKSAGTAAFVILLMVAAAPYGFAQGADATATNFLGVHDDGGRGCVGCHAPHSGEPGGSEAESIALWGPTASPVYGATVRFGDTENYVEVPPARLTSGSGEVTGVVLCLSCHDGNLTPQNVMSRQSYAAKMGLIGNLGGQRIPLLADDALAGNYTIDHPMGAEATIPLGNGLFFSNGVFTVIPGSPYAQFLANYGLRELAPGKWFMPYGVNRAGRPYVMCTTCHNQHGTGYASFANGGGGSNPGDHAYHSYFFVRGSYDPQSGSVPRNL